MLHLELLQEGGVNLRISADVIHYAQELVRFVPALCQQDAESMCIVSQVAKGTRTRSANLK